jgi:hypothetical protein
VCLASCRSCHRYCVVACRSVLLVVSSHFTSAPPPSLSPSLSLSQRLLVHSPKEQALAMFALHGRSFNLVNLVTCLYNVGKAVQRRETGRASRVVPQRRGRRAALSAMTTVDGGDAPVDSDAASVAAMSPEERETYYSRAVGAGTVSTAGLLEDPR